MNRRDTVLALLALGVAAGPQFVFAQQAGKMYRIGYRSTPTRASVEPGVQSFLRQ